MAGTLLLGLAIVLWGTAFRAHAVGAESAPPLVFAAIRVVPAALLLVAVAWASGQRLARRHVGWAVLTGLLMVAVTLGGVCEAIPRAGPAQTAVVFNSYPFFVVIVGAWVLRERMSLLGVVGLCAGFAGLVVLVSAQENGVAGPNVVIGTAIAAATAVAWGTGTIIVARLLRSGSGPELLSFTAVQHVAGALALVVFALPAAGETDWGSRDLWLASAWVSIGSSAIASVAFFEALRRMPATRASTWQFLVPTVAVLVEAARGAVPSAVVLGGMAASIAGVCIVSLADGSRARDNRQLPIRKALR